MGADRVRALWEKASFWLALLIGGAFVANTAVALGESLLGGIAVATGMCALFALFRQSWNWFPHTALGSFAVAAIGFVTLGSLVGVGAGALEGITSFPDVRFDQFDRMTAVMFGVLYGGGMAYVRWTAFRAAEKDEHFAASPERPG